METTLDLSRWRETPRGVGYRRWTMVSTGLRQLFGTRFFKILLALAWSGGLAIAAAGFLFSQSIASGGWLETLAVQMGPRAQAVVSALGAFVLLFPDICIGGFYTLIFWAHSFVGLALSLVALTVLAPRLITRDRATNALTVYLSRPLTSGDYLLGKLGTITGVLVLLWTGPLLAGWLLGLLFAPDRDFVVYSFGPLLRGLAFNGIALVALACIALGVSAASRTSRGTIVIWIGLWIVVGTFAKAPGAPAWLQRASFTQDLNQVRQAVFRLDDALLKAGTNLPIIGKDLADSLTQAGRRAEPRDAAGALGGLTVFCVLSSFVFFRKLRAE